MLDSIPESNNYVPRPYNINFPTYPSYPYYEKNSENNSLNNDNSNKVLLQNKKKKEENPLQKVLEKIPQQIFIKSNNDVNNNINDFDKRLFNLKNNYEVPQFNNFFEDYNSNLLINMDEESENKNKENKYNIEPITNDNNNNIYIKNDDKNININNNQSSTFFTILKNQNNNNSNNIQYKKESAQKTIKTHILNSNLKILNNLIKLHLPPKLKRRSNKIHPPKYKLLTSKVNNRDNKKFINMTFWKILIYGRNQITKKNLQYKNYIHINEIIEYLNIYSNEHDGLSDDLRKIKELLYMKPLDLINNFVNSEDFKEFQKRKQSIIFRKGILEENKNIDIFTKKGIVTILESLEDNDYPKKIKRNISKKKVISGIFRKCFHYHHKYLKIMN